MSLVHQVEEERYRTLPPDLSGRFIAHCWFDIAGSDKRRIDTDKPDNGIGRLIMSFAFGFDDSKKSREQLCIVWHA